jgi:uncharacterized protein
MLISWILRILLLLLVIRLVMRFVEGLMRGLREPARPQPTGGRLVRDPVCGTFVPETRALSSRAGDDVFFFCSEACRDAWRRGARS